MVLSLHPSTLSLMRDKCAHSKQAGQSLAEHGLGTPSLGLGPPGPAGAQLPGAQQRTQGRALFLAVWKQLLLVGTCSPSWGRDTAGSSARSPSQARAPEMEAWLQLVERNPVGPVSPPLSAHSRHFQ